MSNPFQKAKRALSYLNIAITGPSGSGKTWSALTIATGMGGKIAVVDTENGSASLYSKFFEFDVLTINPPFVQEKYVRAVKAAVENGYDIVIIDSFSHVWAGEGGAQEQKDALDARGGSKFANWKDPKAALKKVMSEMLQSKIHVIATMRSKQAYAQVADEKGRSQVKKMGMDPIAEPGIEYEFTTVLDMDMSHQAQASKDRTHLFDGKTFKPTKETGADLMAWRNSGEPTPPEPPKQPVPKVESKGPAPTPTAASHAEASDARADAIVMKANSGEMRAAESPGDFVITFGRKYKDQTIKSIKRPELESYLKWLNATCVRDGTDLSYQAKMLEKNFNAFYGLPTDEAIEEALANMNQDNFDFGIVPGGES